MTAREQYITLGAGSEVFAIPVAQVQEILDLRPIARLPHAPPALLGLTDVRGESVPVLALSALLGLPCATAEEAAGRILVLDLAREGRRLRLGLRVERVFEVTALDGDGAGPAPETGRAWSCRGVSGIGRRGGGFVMVLDLPRLIGAEEMAALEAPALA